MSAFVGPDRPGLLPSRPVSSVEEAVESRALAACAEYPNDNPGLHRGAIWMCPGVTGPATCDRRVVEAPALPVDAEDCPLEAPAPPLEVLECALEAPATAIEALDCALEAPAPPLEAATDPTPPVLETADGDDGGDIEIV